MKDPVLLAESVKKGLLLHVAGEYKPKWDAIRERFVLPAGTSSPEDALMKLRGPFLQALSIPNWSDQTWESFARSVRGHFAPGGLHPALVAGLHASGIRKLQRFQEETVCRIVDDKDTLIVAGTGRGKSESWLIPLFQAILDAKLKGEEKGTKVVIIYPTKALAQDQLRRVIGYLLQINRGLQEHQQITVGIFDGDTPSKRDRNVTDYLSKAFREMDCPLKGTKELCKTCLNPAVQISIGEERQRLIAPDKACQAEIDLSYIYLTRDDVLEAEVDILITNPDTINLHLLNINEPRTRKLFVEQPRFIVLDEVHIYSGIFGAFVAMLMRRLRQVRQHLKVAHPLRFIAASATVQNKEEIFERLGGVSATGAVINEQPGDFPVLPSHPLEPMLTRLELDESQLLSVWEGKTDPTYEALLQALGLSRPGHASQLPAKQTMGEQILLKLSEEPEPRLRFIAEIYLAMRNEVQTLESLRAWLHETYHLTPSEAETLLANFTLLAGIAGILERRAHLFAWALDGYYGCAACGRVHGSPVAKCDCGNAFISRMAFCTHCGGEVQEVWACPACRHGYPMVANRDGESLVYDPPVCQCNGKPNVTIRALIHLSQTCNNCHSVYQVPTAATCPECQAWVVKEGEHLRCTSPACDWHGAGHSHACPSCGTHEASVQGSAGFRCGHCGKLGGDGSCCGQPTVPAIRLPWICTSCGRSHWEETPRDCSCGKGKFFWSPLLDPAQVVREGTTDWFPGSKEGQVRHVSNKVYKVADVTGRLVEVSKAGKPLMPCSHPHTRWEKRRFNAMVRTPENILATGSQILLRTLLKDDRPLKDRLMDVKMLTFSDSYRDMENVNRNFNEPERTHFLETSLVQALSSAAPLPAADALAEVMAGIEAYGESIYGTRASQIFHDLRIGKFGHEKKKRWVREALAELIRGGGRDTSRLVEDGVVQVRLSQAAFQSLTAANRELLGRFWQNWQGYKATNLHQSGRLEPADRIALHELEKCGILVQEETKLYLNPEVLEVGLVGPTLPGRWVPATNRFVPELALQLGLYADVARFVRYDVPWAERIDPNSRFFSLRLYELTYSPPALLTSNVYKGDTTKEERRRIEHQFKTKPSVHHISSGPAMEVGIDVGNLNAMALYGTPPNINGYLQRIGRAGRRSKRSLVMTVSKSNPIDYYYYRYPTKLIQSSAQPVPLTDQNREVLKIALTWAVLDYIACHYWIPWIQHEVQSGANTVKTVLADGLPLPIGQLPAQKLVKFSGMLFSRPVAQLQKGKSLEVLSNVVAQDAPEITAWLTGLMGDEILPIAERDALIAQVLKEFDSATWSFIKEQFDWLDDQLEDLEDEERDLRKRIRQETDPLEEAKLEDRRSRIREDEDRINVLHDDLKKMSVIEVQRLSSKRPYAYSIRSVSSTVQVERRGPADQEDGGALQRQALPSRDLAMALGEYHPFALVLQGEQKHVVTGMQRDEFGTIRLQQAFGAHRRICTDCGALLDMDATTCIACGGQRVKSAELVVPGHVTIAPFGQRLFEANGDGELRLAEALYPPADEKTEVEKTLPARLQEVGVSGDPLAMIHLAAGQLILGDLPTGTAAQARLTLEPVTLAQFVPSFSIVWKDGQRRYNTLLDCCGEEGCDGVVGLSPDPFCSRNPNHDPSKARPVIMGREFATRALRISVGAGEQAERLAHSLAHGIRMALQEVAGVDIRMLGEIAQGTEFLVYEDVEGGYGILDLLLKRGDDGQLVNLARALDLVAVQTDGTSCKCEDGCPYCLFQFGCCKRNRPASLTRKGVHGLAAPFRKP